jgi:integrase
VSPTAAVVALPRPVESPLHAQLAVVLRAEFATPVIRVDVDNPVFARGRCRIAVCDRGAWSRLLCMAHYTRWRTNGRPEIDSFVATTGPVRSQPNSELIDTFDLRPLPRTARLEVAYIIQCYSDDRAIRLLPGVVRQLVELIVHAGAESLLDRPVQRWVKAIQAKGNVDPSRAIGLVRYAFRHLIDLAEQGDSESEFARDTWRASAIGTPQTRSPHQIRFDPITQAWLRAAVKRWARFRLGAGKAFGSVQIDVRALGWFSRFLADTNTPAASAAALDREVLGRYLSWLANTPLAGHTKSSYLVGLRGFLASCQRYDWLVGLPANAAIYLDELPRRPQPLPRFIPEFVMNTLEDPVRLALLADDTTRHLVIVLMETGLRVNDACWLPFDPVIQDSVGWPCLRYYNAKMAAEQLVPLSAKAADAIRAQQAELRQRWPAGPAVLFPSPYANPDGTRPFNYATLRDRLQRWQDTIDLRDEAGRKVRVTPHRFRHTLGTRMINSGVPQHVVQRMLGHASPQMTARYATLHDTTVRAAFDSYQHRRVDITGRNLGFDPDAPTADAEWVKHNLSLVAASLPNGYCGRPPQQDCPHPNACLTCPDFQTTPQFLDIHRRQRDQTVELITAAERSGRHRLVDNHRQIHTNLERIITALEKIEEPTHQN